MSEYYLYSNEWTEKGSMEDSKDYNLTGRAMPREAKLHFWISPCGKSCASHLPQSTTRTQNVHFGLVKKHTTTVMSLMKLLDPLIKPAAKFYQARLALELNKMGMSTHFYLSRRNRSAVVGEQGIGLVK